MQYHDFLGKVQAQARLPDQPAAIKATRATMETIGERIMAGQAKSLAAELPEEIGRFLQSTADEQNSFDLEAFWEKVGQREGEDLPQAVHHARAVFSVMQEAVSTGSVDDLRDALPDEYGTLFESGSEGELK